MANRYVTAPWTLEQVAAIRRWQASPAVHPYTCSPGTHRGTVMKVTREALICPVCDRHQDWVWNFTIEPPPDLFLEFPLLKEIHDD